MLGRPTSNASISYDENNDTKDLALGNDVTVELRGKVVALRQNDVKGGEPKRYIEIDISKLYMHPTLVGSVVKTRPMQKAAGTKKG